MNLTFEYKILKFVYRFFSKLYLRISLLSDKVILVAIERTFHMFIFHDRDRLELDELLTAKV